MRYLSLDVFRGLTIALMIVVNTSGTGSPPFPILDHAEWFGFTLADLVFPSFLFAIGNSMAFSGATKLGNAQYYQKVLKRGAILFALGIFLNWFPFFIYNAQGQFEWKYFENLRFMGVLQRIALCYVLGAFLIKHLSFRGLLIACAILGLGYWALLWFGAPNGLAYEKAANFGSQIDNFIIPKSHIFRRDDGFEPEGILGTIPATINLLAGSIIGKLVKETKDKSRLCKDLFAYGAAFIIVATFWDKAFPISKKLWTSSYVLLTIGINMIIVEILVYLIDIKGQKFGVKFFEAFGQNPLAMYVFSILLLKIIMTIRVAPNLSLYAYISDNLFQSMISGPWGSLAFAASYMLVCWGFAHTLSQKQIIIKI